VSGLAGVLRRLQQDLGASVPWALVGGLAVSARAEPRTTRDVDVAVAARDDGAAERIVRQMVATGYEVLDEGIFDNLATGRLAAVRLGTPTEPSSGIVVDLLFNSSGIESELVAAAEPIEVFAGTVVPVATTGDLLALKVLAGRAQDLADAIALLATASARDVGQARERIALIGSRGCDRGRDLAELLRRLVAGEPVEIVR
jgi:hypothetical protein